MKRFKKKLNKKHEKEKKDIELAQFWQNESCDGTQGHLCKIKGVVQPSEKEIDRFELKYGKYIATVAIEISTAFSGYVFTFAREPDYIYTGTYDGALQEDREPTSLLLNPDKSFNSFGVAAEDEYIRLSLIKKQDNYTFIKKPTFTMQDGYIVISDGSGKLIEARIVVAHIIRYLKDKALGVIDIKPNVFDSDLPIRWILTLPDDSDVFCDMMKQAASDAGIKTLSFISEDIAMKRYCKSFLKAANMFVALDFGEGKVGICTYLRTVQENKTKQENETNKNDDTIKEDETIKEKEPIKGEETIKKHENIKTKESIKKDETIKDYKTIKNEETIKKGDIIKGQETIKKNKTFKKDETVKNDEAIKDEKTILEDETFKQMARFKVELSAERKFCSLLSKMFGDERWNNFMGTHAFDYLKLMQIFDERKRTFDTNTQNVCIRLPSSLLVYKKSDDVDKQSVNEELATTRVQNNSLILTHKAMADLFQPSLQKVVKLLKDVEEFDNLVLVGGVCECRYVRQVITSQTNFKVILLAPSPRLGILKGAISSP